MTFHGRELTVMLYQLKEDAGSRTARNTYGKIFEDDEKNI